MSDDLTSLTQFDGRVRLFPLPNLVLFPHVVQPLHIFEPRYRLMTKDALADDRLIAMVLLRPGWDAEYLGRPAIHPVACLGKIVADQQLADGRYNLLLRGMVRLRIEEEFDSGKLYRCARVKILLDQGSLSAQTQARLRRKLADLIPDWFAAKAGPLVKQFQKLLKGGLALGALCDVLSFALPLDVQFKQRLLEEAVVEERIRQLLQHLDEHSPTPTPAAASESRSFPPAFSNN
jgi:Lon protease-like protein